MRTSPAPGSTWRPWATSSSTSTSAPCSGARHWDDLAATAALAGELGIWVAVGSIHPLTAPTRPHNSLYVISDERLLSNTKVSFLYTPGADPVTFEVDGVRFGCALGMESHFPEVFAEHERLDVDCILFSTTGGASTARQSDHRTRQPAPPQEKLRPSKRPLSRHSLMKAK